MSSKPSGDLSRYMTEADLDGALTHVEGDLRTLHGARVFLTGGTGFFGRALLALVAHASARLRLDLSVTVLTRDPAAFRAHHPALANLPFLTLCPGDVCRFEPLPHGFSHIVHAATDTDDVAKRNRMQLIETITLGTMRVLECAEASGATRLLYVSSGAVYGRQPPELPAIPEEFGGACDPLDPDAAYGTAKRLGEQLCAIASAEGRTACTIARCFAFSGPGLAMDGRFAIGDFIRDAVNGLPVVVSGDGTPVRSYLYSGDLAAWLVALLVRGQAGSAYNVGSEHAITIGDLARRVAELIDGSGPVKIAGRSAPGATRQRYVPATERARRDLGLDAWTSLDSAILKTADAMRR